MDDSNYLPILEGILKLQRGVAALGDEQVDPKVKELVTHLYRSRSAAEQIVYRSPGTRAA